MSSYLTFYLLPKKTKKRYNYSNEEGEKEIDIELSAGKPMVLKSFSRNNEIYSVFYENLNPAYAGMEEKYTEVTEDGCKRVIEDLENEIKSTEKRLAIDYKILKEGGYNSGLYDNIHSMQEYIDEQKETLETVKQIYSIVYECSNGYNDFEKVLINID